MVPLQSRMDRKVDKISGAVTFHQGDVYYSPNSSRHVPIPPFDAKIGVESAIFHIQTASEEDFTQPHWWTETFGWLAFVPRNPCYVGPLLERLSKVPKHLHRCIEKGRERYHLPAEVQDSWIKLDWWLSLATSVISKELKISVGRPFSPWAIGYMGKEDSHGRMLTLIYRSRGLFKVWMGLLSHLIAEARSANETGTDMYWYRALLAHGFQPELLEALQLSVICDFSATTERAGVFVDITSKNTNQPTVEWFLKYNVPVWYRWGTQEMSIPSLAYLAPLSDQFQRAVLASSNPVQEVCTMGKRPEYEVFFAARDARNARRLLYESAIERQTRLNRERHPPTVSAKVFKWVPSDDDETVWCRVQVCRADREETLGEYSQAQTRYDSFSNEWDCCEGFGPGDEDSDGEFYSFSDELTGSITCLEPPYENNLLSRTLTPPPQAEQSLDSERLDVPRIHPLQHSVSSLESMPPALPELSSSASSEPMSLIYPKPTLNESRKIAALQQEIFEILALHYGFTKTSSLPSSLPLLTSEAECKKLARLLGLSWSRCQPYIGQVLGASLAKSYLEGIIEGCWPEDDNCDFNVTNCFSLDMSDRGQYLRIVESVEEKPRIFYMFDFGIKSERPWKLTLTNATDALLVCRLHSRFRESDVAEYLLQHGIAFRTFLPSEIAPKAPRKSFPPGVLPMRLSDSQYGVKDYASYIRHREILLTQPRGRAALMQGGIIWRLSTSVVSFSSVLQGPTGWSAIPNTMIVVRDPKTNELFIDDALTEVELNLISGSYLCSTGTLNQTALRSWFPTVMAFNGSGEDYGRWNEQREDAFSRRLGEINDINHGASFRGPLLGKKWRDLMRGSKDVRLLKAAMESFSQAFIKQHMTE